MRPDACAWCATRRWTASLQVFSVPSPAGLPTHASLDPAIRARVRWSGSRVQRFGEGVGGFILGRVVAGSRLARG